jgi:hypothetical protein
MVNRKSSVFLAVLASGLAAAAGYGQAIKGDAHISPQTTSEYIVDGGFEQASATGNIAPGWTAVSSFSPNALIWTGPVNGAHAHSGSNYAFLGDYDNEDDTLAQTVSIPSNATSANLSFWTSIATNESGTTNFDFLDVEIWSPSGALLGTPYELGNANSVNDNNVLGNYFHVQNIDLSAYHGQTVQIVFHVTTDSSLATDFLIDDVSLQVTTSSGGGGCTPDANTLCLNNGRFEVIVQWTDFQGNTGLGNVVPFGSSDSGLMWFFNSNNWEMLVKVLNGCGLNNHYWVFAALTTNVQYTIQVTDTATGQILQYSNPLGNPSPAITDAAAFATCP